VLASRILGWFAAESDRTEQEQFGDLQLSAKRKSLAVSNAEVLAVEAIFGPPPILPGEDASAYEALLSRVSTDVKPADIIEKIWVRDIVDLTWEILRWRKIKMTLASEKVPAMLSEKLRAFVHETPEYEEEEKAGTITEFRARTLGEEFADRWAMKDPEAVAWVNELVANGHISMDAVRNSAFAKALHDIERIDRLATIAENRRNSVLREIERRRSTFARSLRGEIEKVEDAEFEIVEPKSTPRAIKASGKAA
jgi:hypothetical protein